MEYTSYNERNRIKSTFEQIHTAIGQLQEWNAEVASAEDYYMSSTGMQKLAASCMLIEAIGEGVKQIDNLTKEEVMMILVFGRKLDFFQVSARNGSHSLTSISVRN